MDSLILVGVLALILVAAAMSAPVDTSGVRHLLSGYSIVLASFALYGLFPAVLLLLRGGTFYWAPGFEANHAFAKAVALTGLALLAFLYGYSIAARKVPRAAVPGGRAGTATPGHRHPGGRSARVASANQGRPTLQSAPAAWRVAAALIAGGLLLRLYIVAQLGGINATIVRWSGASRAHVAMESAAPHLVALANLASLADVGATWILVTAIRLQRPVVVPAAVYTFVLASSYLVSGKRLVLILPLLIVLCAVHAYRRPITYRWAPWMLVAVPLMGMATLLLRVFLPASRADIAINLDNVQYAHGSRVDLYFNSLEFSTTEMVAVATKSAHQINASLGGSLEAFITTNLVPFLYAVPRALYPAKPVTFIDTSHGISAAVDNTDIHYATVGYACTLVGTSYITAGVVGVLVIFVLLGYLTRRYDDSHIDLPKSFGGLVIHALVLTVLFTYMRQGTLGWTFIVAVFQQHGTLFGAILLRDRVQPAPVDLRPMART